jgi:DNA-binding YbaB/EbfC family protein
LPRKIKHKSGGSPRGMGGMLQQLQSLQDEMVKAQSEVAAMVVTSTAGGGAVTATVTGERRVQSIVIEPEVVDPEDVEMLQDLIVAAVNEAIERSKSMAAEQLGALTSGLGLPPGLGLG